MKRLMWFSVLCIVLGAVLLGMDSRQQVAGFVSADMQVGDVIDVGPTALSLAGQVLLAAGVAALGGWLGRLVSVNAFVIAHRRRILISLFAAAVVLALGAVGVLIWDASQPRDFGWFAYAPLTQQTFTASMTTGWQIFGKFLLGIAIFLAGAGLGLRRDRDAATGRGRDLPR